MLKALLPFSYATRHLLRDIPRFLQKVGGSAIVVLLVMAAGAFNGGMEALLSSSGSENNVILLSAGSEEAIERSEIPIQTEELAKAGIRGISSDLGAIAVSGEVHFMGSVQASGQSDRAQAFIRGVNTSAIQVHQRVRILEGDFPKSGEVMVGKLSHSLLGVDSANLTVGGKINFESEEFIISGIFEAPGTVMESEIWMDRSDLMTLTQMEALSCVIVRLESADFYSATDLFTKQRLDLELSAVRESDYYSKLADFYGPIRAMTWVTAGLIGAGAIFGGFNMLYAAFATRIRELATLQAIGFSRTALFISLIQESLLATLSGTLLAALLAVLLLEGQSVQFSMGTFHLSLTGMIVLSGLFTGFLLGILGAIPPAIRCLGSTLTSALRS